jgi:hypothetical protein
MRFVGLTSLNKLSDLLPNHARIRLFSGLTLEDCTRVASTPGIQSFL